MFVLDGLRAILNNKIRIPQFHLGLLGFVPGMEVYYHKGAKEPEYGQELSLTQFQGNVRNLFLLKCVFRERSGVVLRALSAFSTLGLNVVSLETATIHSSNKHILFCNEPDR